MKDEQPEIPPWARWAAMDANGRWWCYEAEPHRHDSGWYENVVGRSQRLSGCETELPTVEEWTSSLTRLPG